jgi:hypothetical protein
MKRLRRQVIILACWLVGFCSAEQLLEPIDISSVTYIFIFGIMIVILVTPRVARVPLWVLLTAPIPVFLTIKYWINPLVGSVAILLTIAEVCAIVLTTFLAYQVSMAINEFENAVTHIMVGQPKRITENASQGAGVLYREVRRARNHQRPLSLMALAIDEKSLKLDLDRIVQEAQQAMMKQYAQSGLSKILCEKLEDCDTIVQNNGHFLVLLPETMPADLPGLIDRLRQQVSDQLGIELNIGAAFLPQDSYTLEGLVAKATRGMKTDLASELFLELERMSLKQDVS